MNRNRYNLVVEPQSFSKKINGIFTSILGHMNSERKLIKDKIENKDLEHIKTYEFERSELKKNERALKIQNHVEVNGFPTIVIKINNEY
mgnify:CR=1 FL=1